MCGWPLGLATCESCLLEDSWLLTNLIRYALAADIQTIPGLPTAPGYLNVDIDPDTGDIDGLF